MRKLFIILVIVICYMSAFSQEKGINQIRYENFRNLNIGMSPDEVVSLLSFKTDINKSFFGGIFIGIGLLSKDSINPSSYTGTLNLHEYIFIFDNGKLKKKSIDSTKIVSETISGQYINIFIGKTQTSWSLVNGKFDSKTVALEFTEDEKRIIDEKYQQHQIIRDKRLKEVTDSLTNNGYKIITEKGFDSFIIKKTRLQDIINILGSNNIREDRRKDGITKITYRELGISFYVGYDKKTDNGFLYEIRLMSPFKGCIIEQHTNYNYCGVVLGKTTLKEFKSFFKMSTLGTWEGYENNCLFVEKRPYYDMDESKYVVVFENPINRSYDPNYVINEFRIHNIKNGSGGIHIQGF